MFISVIGPARADCGLLWRDYFWKRASVSDVQKQLDSGAPIDGICGEWSESPLHVAARVGSVDSVEFMIASWANVNARNNNNNFTPLFSAIGSTSPERAGVVAALIAGAANVNVHSYHVEYTPLIYAITHKRGDIAQLLLDAGARVNATDYVGRTAFQNMIPSYWHEETAGILLRASADLHHQDEDGNTALHTAARFCSSEIARDLLKLGASKDIRNQQGHRAFNVIGEFIHGGTNEDCGDHDRVVMGELLQ